jgi:hypothetical protein
LDLRSPLQAEKLVVANRGCCSGEEVLWCEQADITVTLAMPLRSSRTSQGRFSTQDVVDPGQRLTE